MSSRPCGEACFRGHVHEHQPAGEEITLGGVTSYIVKPTEATETAVFLLHDAFGFRMPNIRRIADQVAAQTGFICVVPDLLNNDAAPEDLSSFDIVGWLGRHTEKDIDPIVRVVLEEVATEYGVETFGAMGYCLGAKYVLRHLRPEAFAVGFIAHPSLTTEDEFNDAVGPLSMACAERDEQFSDESRHTAEEILKSKSGSPYQMTVYGGTNHGFAVRGDLKKDNERKTMDVAFRQALAWLQTYL